MLSHYLRKFPRMSENYRPTNLTSGVGKLPEGILREMVYLYLERQGLLKNSHWGLVHGRSCFKSKRMENGRWWMLSTSTFIVRRILRGCALCTSNPFSSFCLRLELNVREWEPYSPGAHYNIQQRQYLFSRCYLTSVT